MNNSTFLSELNSCVLNKEDFDNHDFERDVETNSSCFENFDKFDYYKWGFNRDELQDYFWFFSNARLHVEKFEAGC